MFTARLHPDGWHNPCPGVPIYLTPISGPNFTRTGGGQHHELKRKPGFGGRSRQRDLAYCGENFGVGQGGMMGPHPFYDREYFHQGAACGIVKSPALRHCPVENCLHSLTDPSGRLWLVGPNWRQHRQNVGCGDFACWLLAYQRPGVGGQCILPLSRVFGVAPSRAAQLDHLFGGLGKCGQDGAIFLDQRIAAFGNSLAVLSGQSAGLGQGDRWMVT